MANFSTLLRRHLQQTDLSERQIATNIGVNPSTFSRWVVGDTRPAAYSFDAVDRLPEVLGLTSEASAELLAAAFPARGLKRASARWFTSPFTVPPLPSPFVGRDEEIEELIQRLQIERMAIISTPPLQSITGAGGIGKTCLAIAVAHRLHQAGIFTDGIFWGRVDMADPIALLNLWLSSLGGDPAISGDDLQAKSAQWRDLTQRRHCLIVLDNVRPGAHIEPFLPAVGKSAVLITSRDQNMPGLSHGYVLPLGPLPRHHSLALLESILGPERIGVELEAADRLAHFLGDHPLALNLAARRLAIELDEPIASFQQRLEARPLALLQDHHSDDKRDNLQLCFAESFAALTPGEQALFTSLGIWNGATFTTEIASALSGQDNVEVKQRLAGLVRLSLLQREGEPGWYSIHPALRVYAARLLQQQNGKEAALKRLQKYWQASFSSPLTFLWLALQKGSLKPDSQAENVWGRWQEKVREIISRYHGLIRVYNSSQTEATWLIIFGIRAPVQAEAAELALRCALHVQNEVREAGLRLSAGVTAVTENSHQLENISLPDSPPRQRAAALCAAAGKNGILCDETTYKAAKYVLNFGDPILVEHLGSHSPVTAVSPIMPTSPPLPHLTDHTLIDRETEMRAITNWLLESKQGQLRVIGVIGAAGIGKSHLAARTVQIADQQGFVVCMGASSSLDHTVPFTPWKTIFSQLLGLENVADNHQQAFIKQQLANIEKGLEEQLPLLNDILPLTITESQWSRRLDTRSRHQTLIHLLLRLLLQRVSRRPHLIILEDVHWLDSLSWSLLTAIIRHSDFTHAPLALLLDHRPFYSSSPKSLPSIQASPHFRSLMLEDLTPAAIHQLAAEWLGMSELPRELSRWLDAEVPGNPLVLREALNQLIEQGILARAKN